jgi:hypothetical protein
VRSPRSEDPHWCQRKFFVHKHLMCTVQVVSVAKIIVHPSYSQSSSTGQNNLALWKLSEPVSTSVYSTVCLPAQGAEQAGGATLVGWRISLLVGELQ